MHPILGNRTRLGLYFAGWGIVSLLLAGVLWLAAPRPFGLAIVYTLPLTMIYADICLSAWWVCRGMPIDRTDLIRLLTTLLGTAVFSSLIWTGLGALAFMAYSRFHWIWPGVDRSRDLMILGIAGVPLYLLSVVVHYLLILFERASAAERRALESAVAGREAELRALRAQLHPHFLFNSLNSINALVGSDPEGARRMCQSLGDFLRGTLSLANRDRVPLSDELTLIERYLSIERVRFGERLGVERTIQPGAERCLVPPLLLQPLVENAVKHGVSERIEGGVIRIEAARSADALTISIENPVDENPSGRPGERLGLENVRRRLAAMDGGDARLSVQQDAKRFRVSLTMRAIESEAAVTAGPAPGAESAPSSTRGAAGASSTAPAFGGGAAHAR